MESNIAEFRPSMTTRVVKPCQVCRRLADWLAKAVSALLGRRRQHLACVGVPQG